jgi:serine protease Do
VKIPKLSAALIVCGLLAAMTRMSLISVATPVAHADRGPDPIAAVVAKVSSAVVRVVTVRHSEVPQDGSLGMAKAADTVTTDRTTTAIGSGFIIDRSGYIVTNKHVVEGAISVFAVTADGLRYKAKIVGMPAKADMALLRIDAGDDLPFVPFGDSDKMHVGDTVIAVGSPFGFDNSVTSGIISAVNRDIMESPFDDYIQTDAAINHGNSGGPLFNLAGEVIGMNSIIFAPTSGFAGLGFALPSNDVEFVVDRLMKTGEVRAGMLPIHTQQVSWMLQQAFEAPDLSGALVTSVHDIGDKMLLGQIKAGDVIRGFNGQKVLDPRDLARKAARVSIGGDAVLEVCRAGVLETVHVTIQAWPEAEKIKLENDVQRTLGLDLTNRQGNNGQPIVAVASVASTGTAADSGIQKDDIIVEVQQTPVSNSDQAMRIFGTQSSMKRHFAAVLVEHESKLSWMSVAVPE